MDSTSPEALSRFLFKKKKKSVYVFPALLQKSFKEAYRYTENTAEV